MSEEDPGYSRYRAHPWHGLEVGPEPPRRVHAFIEITPFDVIKYEVDKRSGYLRVDRPHRTSSLPPALYGFVPRSYCGERVRGLMPGAARGDGDPLDICVLSERPIARAEVLLVARVLGGLPMQDGDEADDKIIAVLDQDPVWSGAEDLSQLPEALVARLRHFFGTYKTLPGEPSRVRVGDPYARRHAERVVEAAMADYQERFGAIGARGGDG